MATGIHSRWKCGKCGKWNDISEGLCTRCSANQIDWAHTYRDTTQLTPEEEGYYHSTVPNLTRDVREIKQVLAEIHRVLEEIHEKIN
mgnify:CR=1 FL=1